MYSLEETKTILKKKIDKTATKKALLHLLDNSLCFVALNCEDGEQ
jgi:hypothetical protein